MKLSDARGMSSAHGPSGQDWAIPMSRCRRSDGISTFAVLAVHQVDFCPMHGQGRKFPIRIGGNSLGVQVIGGSKISHYGGYFDEH